jgi:hypothetical protein
MARKKKVKTSADNAGLNEVLGNISRVIAGEETPATAPTDDPSLSAGATSSRSNLYSENELGQISRTIETVRRIRSDYKRCREDWLTDVGPTLVMVRDRVLLMTRSRDVHAQAYRDAIGPEVERLGLGEDVVTRDERSCLLKIMDQLSDVQEWLSERTNLNRLNHPKSIWKAFKDHWGPFDDDDPPVEEEYWGVEVEEEEPTTTPEPKADDAGAQDQDQAEERKTDEDASAEKSTTDQDQTTKNDGADDADDDDEQEEDEDTAPKPKTGKKPTAGKKPKADDAGADDDSEDEDGEEEPTADANVFGFLSNFEKDVRKIKKWFKKNHSKLLKENHKDIASRLRGCAKEFQLIAHWMDMGNPDPDPEPRRASKAKPQKRNKVKKPRKSKPRAEEPAAPTTSNDVDAEASADARKAMYAEEEPPASNGQGWGYGRAKQAENPHADLIAKLTGTLAK